MDEPALSPDADVIVVGGGPVGATLALALAASGPRVTLLEAGTGKPGPDDRTLALSYGSRLILERIGVWSALGRVTPITRIHVSQRGGFGRAELSAQEARVPALGYVLRYGALAQALAGRLAGSGIDYRTGAEVKTVTPGAASAQVTLAQGAAPLTARLVAVADGGKSLKHLPGIARRERDYGQTAVVCEVATTLPHRGVAYERFTPEGPVALLPAGERYALVWTARPARAAEIMALDDARFLTALQRHFGDRQGRFTWVGPRAGFPLRLRYSTPVTLARVVLVGNAAQTLHPVAGQGFNLGLRDAWDLAEEIRTGGREAIGAASMLARYAARRRPDTRGGIFFTDFLVRGFSNALPGLAALRGVALSVLDVLPPAKDFLMRRMLFGARG